ncbi:MAG: ATPase, T2SS/T4P/T4SS family [Candidatus Omnitrophota bacterium]
MSIIINKKIGEVLVEQGLLLESQLEEVLKEQKQTGEKIGEILVRKGWLNLEERERYLSIQSGITAFNLSSYLISPEVFKLVPEDFARQHRVVPVFLIENILTIAMAEPNNVMIIDELRRMTHYTIDPVFADELEIRKVQDQCFGGISSLDEIIASIDKTKLAEMEKKGEDAPIVKIVNYLIFQAVQLRASDIHIEPEKRILNVRYRVDGMLHRNYSLSIDLAGAIISRIKIMSGLDIADKRLPQDGRIMMKIGNRDIDFRVSTCPTVYGENVVLRILDKSGLTLTLDSLGFPERELRLSKELIASPYGIILVTGPTGSGKTTTLYAALQLLNKENINIMTVEDPVEYQFPGMRQVHVNPKSGLTFAVAVRSFLRQDPNIIMVGEIRDRETAEIAVQSALTGHLVFSTIHTNDAATVFTRLINMGVEPFLISSALLGVLAQRLVRRTCDKCKEDYTPSDEALKTLGLEDMIAKGVKFSRGKGCQYCNKSGFKGRLGIFELLCVTPAIQDLVLRKAPSEEIRLAAIKEGMNTLRKTAVDKLLSGLITAEEVVRITIESGS